MIDVDALEDCLSHWLGSYGCAPSQEGMVALVRICLDHLRGVEAEMIRCRELLDAVQSRFPGEDRHATALRYIREREQGSSVIGEAVRGLAASKAWQRGP